MASSTQLEQWAKSNRVVGFLGVFPADELPPRVPQGPWSLVVNYEGHKLPGDHWVGCIGSHGRAVWCSSFGLPPDGADLILRDDTHFKMWLRGVAPHGWTYNKIQMQSLTGDACGEYSVYACKVRGGPLQNPEAYQWVSKNRKRNDAEIKKLVRLKP